MNYTRWTDAEEKIHNINEMETKYIKNCIKTIKNSCSANYTKEDAKEDKRKMIFGPYWCYYHAKRFLEAFENELEIRRRIKNKIYPHVEIKQTCGKCDNRRYGRKKCSEEQTCDDWSTSYFLVREYFSGIDSEVARRGGFVCNDVVYPYKYDEDDF